MPWKERKLCGKSFSRVRITWKVQGKNTNENIVIFFQVFSLKINKENKRVRVCTILYNIGFPIMYICIFIFLQI